MIGIVTSASAVRICSPAYVSKAYNHVRSHYGRKDPPGPAFPVTRSRPALICVLRECNLRAEEDARLPRTAPPPALNVMASWK